MRRRNPTAPAARALRAAALALAGLGFTQAQAQAVPAPDLPALIARLPAEGFARPSGPWTLDLPADHAPHPAARTEAWQVAAHLRDADGAPVGLQLLIFRLGLLPAEEAAPRAGPWTPIEVYRGHVVLLADPSAPAPGAERFRRGLAGAAGYDPATRALRLDDWSLAFAAESGLWRLEASAAGRRVALDLAPARPALPLAAEDAPFRGYAISRLAAEGTLHAPDGNRAVAGSAWFEHLWGELPVPGAAAVVSDRLLLQLDDGTDLALVRSRRSDGRGTPTLEALLIDTDGNAAAPAAAEVAVAGAWQGEAAAWPLAWDLRLDDLELAVRPVAEAQEQAFAAPVWSGLVMAEGQRGGQPVRGLGTLQITAEGLP